MKANVLKSVPSFMRGEEKPQGRNRFTIPKDHTTTFKMMKLIPFFVFEVMPRDIVHWNTQFMARFAPLYLPIMWRVNVAIDYFYVPFTILWQDKGTDYEGWKTFISGSVPIQAPFCTYGVPDVDRKHLINYMGFPTFSTNDQIPNVACLPVAAYYAIYDEYYRNPLLQSPVNAHESLVPGNNGNWLNIYGGVEPKTRNWNRDYFTAATPTPQEGTEVQVPLIFDEDTPPFIGPTRWRKASNNANATAGPLQANPSAYTQDNAGDKVYLDVQETAPVIRQLRFAEVLQKYAEKWLRAGGIMGRFREFSKVMFNQDPAPLSIDIPVFLGGFGGRMVISEVMSTAQTNEASEIVSPVGSYAGQAMVLEGSKNFKYEVPGIHGVIIGIVSVSPVTGYQNGMHRMWSRIDQFDYPFEMFSGIGDQEIFRREVNLKVTSDPEIQAQNDEVFGYIPRFSDWRWGTSLVTGQMKTTWEDFHLARKFPQDGTDPVTLSDEFVTGDPRRTDVFRITEEEHEIYAKFHTDVVVDRALPKWSIPGQGV